MQFRQKLLELDCRMLAGGRTERRGFGGERIDLFTTFKCLRKTFRVPWVTTIAMNIDYLRCVWLRLAVTVLHCLCNKKSALEWIDGLLPCLTSHCSSLRWPTRVETDTTSTSATSMCPQAYQKCCPLEISNRDLQKCTWFTQNQFAFDLPFFLGVHFRIHFNFGIWMPSKLVLPKKKKRFSEGQAVHMLAYLPNISIEQSSAKQGKHARESDEHLCHLYRNGPIQSHNNAKLSTSTSACTIYFERMWCMSLSMVYARSRTYTHYSIIATPFVSRLATMSNLDARTHNAGLLYYAAYAAAAAHIIWWTQACPGIGYSVP